MIQFSDVCKSFGEHRVLYNISCTVREGRITVFLGPSGVGKSVLMKMIVGLEYPDSGHVTVNGRTVDAMGQAELYRLRKSMGMLFQDGALFDSMTVEENVAFPLREHTGLTEKEIARVVSEKLSVVGMAGAGGKMPDQLSGGMRRRAGLARAIALDPDIVLFDEPTTGLDPLMASAIDQLILDMQHSLDCTFIINSHDITGTFRVADDIGVLYGGHLIAYGTKEEIARSRDPRIEAFFSRDRHAFREHGER